MGKRGFSDFATESPMADVKCSILGAEVPNELPPCLALKLREEKLWLAPWPSPGSVLPRC